MALSEEVYYSVNLYTSCIDFEQLTFCGIFPIFQERNLISSLQHENVIRILVTTKPDRLMVCEINPVFKSPSNRYLPKQTAPSCLNFTCTYIMLQKEKENSHKISYWLIVCFLFTPCTVHRKMWFLVANC